jgi:hypothetical protein
LGLPAPGDETQPWKQVLRGGTALALTFLLPILGQLLAIPLILSSGLGASILTWSARRRAKRPPALLEGSIDASAMPVMPNQVPS